MIMAEKPFPALDREYDHARYQAARCKPGRNRKHRPIECVRDEAARHRADGCTERADDR